MKRLLNNRVLLFVWGIPLVVLASWYGGWWFTAGISVVSALAAAETLRMLMPGTVRVIDRVLVGGLLALLPLAISWNGLVSLLWLLIAGLIATGSLALTRSPEDGFRLLISATFTMLYIGLPFTSVLIIRHDPAWTTNFDGMAIIVYLWGGVWATDTFAYLGGRKFGKRPLAPQLSPGKTIEGTISGIVMALVWTGLAGYVLGDVLGWTDRIFLGAIIGVLSVIGDLVESMIKRVANVKDSGSIFFGHGGVLDRFDSLFFVQPAVYLYLVAAGILHTPTLPLLG